MNKVIVIGVMSGTSLDGLDLCQCVFNKKDLSDFKILNSVTYEYPKKILNKLKDIFKKNSSEIDEIDDQYGVFIGKSVNRFISEYKINKVDLISSHGHTVFHQPKNGRTLQIGSGKLIQKITNLKTVNNFRTQDLSMNGQGAPLVPIGDKILFSKFKYCLNLGGFVNVSIKSRNKIIAYDICPLNTVLNFYSKKIGYNYDIDGKLSKKGKINYDLLNKLNSIRFYLNKYPKSLGIEFVNNKIFPLIDDFKISIQDILATFVKHVAFQINQNINDSKEVLVSGGGVFNKNLIHILKNDHNINIHIPQKEIIEFKEALIFGLLGVLRIENKINCLKSVTGAKKDHCSGDIYY
jgi:anhydro-N-acetylmuramic acid kinase|tara:strand:+ start:3886 stop:4935 length:1050 start_codon:yes stop_codon:yes gene_type:complete